MARPPNSDLLYAIALHFGIVDYRSGELVPRYERMLRPVESNTMTATEARARFENTTETDDTEIPENAVETPPQTEPHTEGESDPEPNTEEEDPHTAQIPSESEPPPTSGKLIRTRGVS